MVHLTLGYRPSLTSGPDDHAKKAKFLEDFQPANGHSDVKRKGFSDRLIVVAASLPALKTPPDC